jgi:4-amino-4-deoxy-L-arabinose transferase-like glycosyltransferase
MKRYRTLLLLICIIAVAATARLFMLASVPSGFHSDEAAFGYNAYSLLKTGRDEYGKAWPLILKSFGDDKGALYAYLTVPFVSVLGLTEEAVRLPTALFGIVFVLLTYLLTKELTEKKSYPLMVAAIAALSPLGIVLSRVQSDPLVCVVMLTASIYFFIRWAKYQRVFSYVLFVLFLFLSPFMYQTPRFFFPVFLPVLIFFFWRELSKNARIIGIGTWIVFSCLTALLLLTSGSRFGQLSVFSRADVILPLEESFREDGLNQMPSIVARVFHNKVIDHAQFLTDSAAKYFSYEFLIRDAKEPIRERIQGMGIIYWFELPLFLIGIAVSLTKKDRLGRLSLIWYVIGIAVISFAVDESPNIHRFFVDAFPLSILIASGLAWTYETLTEKRDRLKPLLIGIVAACYIVSSVRFFHQLFIHQPTHEPYYRSDAFKTLIPKLNEIRSSYDIVVFSKENSSPYIHFLFWSAYDPSIYQASGSHRDLDYSYLENLYFVPDRCPFTAPSFWPLIVEKGKRVLFVNSGGCPKTVNSHILETINWKNDMEAFQLVEYQATPSGEMTAK